MVDGFAYHQIIFDEENSPITYKYMEINPSFETIMGLKREDVINKTLIEVFPNIHETNFDWVDAGIRAALHGETIRCEVYAAQVNKWLSCSIFSYEYGYFAIIFHDITDAKFAEQKLKKNLLLLNESKIYEQLRTEFFANISHELRTPLNVILGTLQLINLYLNDGEAIDKYKLNRYSKIMKQNCLRLLRLVNNLIDITKLDSGYMKPSLENKNIVSVVEDITLSVADYIENRSVSLTFDTEVEERIMAVDPDIIERIVLNLLSNAIKFTRPNNSIFVNLYEDNSTFFISVKDTGIGIPEEKLGIIFDRFRQVDQSLTRSSEGSGIGLSLVKSLVELLEGKIHVKSCLGIGSEFTIALPIKVLPDKPALLTKEVNMSQSHVDRINIEFSDVYSCV